MYFKALSGFRALGFWGVRALGLKFEVLGLKGFRALVLGFGVLGFWGVRILTFRVCTHVCESIYVHMVGPRLRA